jgi:hypothetical protein
MLNLDTLTQLHPETVKAWRVDACLDYKTTPAALALDGKIFTSKPSHPEIDGARVVALPITGMAMEMEKASNGREQLSICVLAESREELEAIPCCRIYGSKTSKKETGRCYFKGFFDVACKAGEHAGAFLTHTTHLTRVVVLGETLAADFEEAVLHGRLNAQLWIDSRLA